MIPDFHHPALLAKYGTWARVQVEFYDFIMQAGSNLCAVHWKEMAMIDTMLQFKDGEDLYERTIKGIEQIFPDVSDAWDAFLKHELQ